MEDAFRPPPSPPNPPIPSELLLEQNISNDKNIFQSVLINNGRFQSGHQQSTPPTCIIHFNFHMQKMIHSDIILLLPIGSADSYRINHTGNIILHNDHEHKFLYR